MSGSGACSLIARPKLVVALGRLCEPRGSSIGLPAQVSFCECQGGCSVLSPGLTALGLAKGIGQFLFVFKCLKQEAWETRWLRQSRKHLGQIGGSRSVQWEGAGAPGLPSTPEELSSGGSPRSLAHYGLIKGLVFLAHLKRPR